MRENYCIFQNFNFYSDYGELHNEFVCILLRVLHFDVLMIVSQILDLDLYLILPGSSAGKFLLNKRRGEWWFQVLSNGLSNDDKYLAVVDPRPPLKLDQLCFLNPNFKSELPGNA